MSEIGDLPFVVASVERLQSYGIDTEGLRHSLDGTKAVIHQQLINETTFNALRFDAEVQILYQSSVQELMATPEWGSPEE